MGKEKQITLHALAYNLLQACQLALEALQTCDDFVEMGLRDGPSGHETVFGMDFDSDKTEQAVAAIEAAMAEAEPFRLSEKSEANG